MSGWFVPRPEPFRFGFVELRAMIAVAEDVLAEIGDITVNHERARELVETTPFAGHAAARFRLDDGVQAQQLAQLRSSMANALDELEASLSWAEGQQSEAQAAISEWERDHDEWVRAHNA